MNKGVANSSDNPSAASMTTALNWVRGFYVALLCLWFVGFFSMQISNVANEKAFLTAACSGGGLFVDSLKFYTVGQLAREHAQLYDGPTQFDRMRKLTGYSRTSPVSPCEYTPFFCVAAIPFTFLPIEQACMLTFILWLALACAAVTAILRYRKFAGWECVQFCILLLSSIAAFQNCQIGQIAFLMLACTAAYALFFLKGRHYLAGIALGISFIKPQYAIILCAMPIVLRQWKILIPTAAIVSFMFVLPLVYLGWNTVASYPALLARLDQNYAEINLAMLSIRGFIASITSNDILASRVGTAAFGIGFLLCLFLWHKAAKTGPRAYPWAFAVTLNIVLLFGPHSMFYDFVMLAAGWALTITPWNLVEHPLSIETNWLDRVWTASIFIYPGASWLLLLMHMTWSGVSGVHRCILLFMTIISVARFSQVLAASADAANSDAVPFVPTQE